MSTRLFSLFAGICGILGAVAFGVYGSSILVPLPPPNATVAQVLAFATQYHNAMLLSAWLQSIGSFLLVIFVLALIHLAGVATRFAARVTQLVAAVILAVCLSEGTVELDVIQAAMNGHAQAALTSFDLAGVFVHVFAIAPSLILMLGIALLGTHLLPRVFISMALVLGSVMEIVGFVSLFSTIAVTVFIDLLIVQTFWYAATGIMLIIHTGKASETAVQKGRELLVKS